MTWTQASVTRAVKAALRPAAEMGLVVTGYAVEFTQGEPTVRVTTAQDSAQPSPPYTGGPNVKDLKASLEKRHAARRS